MSSEQVFTNTITRLEEKHDIEMIPENERRQKPSSLFFLWFGSNLTIGDFALGILAAYLGMPVMWTLLSMTLGTVFGGILLAVMSGMGSRSGYPQMVLGRRSFGNSGGSVMAFLQWMNTTGWLVFNTIISASALGLMIYASGSISAGSFSVGLYIIPILIISFLVFVLAYIGHGFVHLFEKIMSLVIGVLFVYISVVSLQNVSLITSYTTPSLSPDAFVGLFASIFALSFSYIMSWGPYASDYSRYLPSGTKSSKVFGYTFLGAVLSTIWAEIAGMLVFVLTGVSNYLNPAAPLQSVLGKYAFLGLITLVLGGLSANALNLYSNSLSFRTTGIRVSRRVLLVFTTAIAVILSYFGYLAFAEDYEYFLYLLDYWITPWIGIMIADFFIVHRGEFRLTKTAFNWNGIISYVVALALSQAFINQSFNGLALHYEGFVATAYLGGAYAPDISYFVSFAAAIILYVVLSRYGVKERSGA